MQNLFTIAIIGRPNVGKSTLFNRMVGKRHAIVHDMPGVTRDRKEGVCKIFDYKVRVIDTAGLNDDKKDEITKQMLKQSDVAAEEADAIFFVLDAKSGLTGEDQKFLRLLRKKGKNAIAVVNKCESKSELNSISEFFKTGFKNVIPISAAHNENIGELYEILINDITRFYEGNPLKDEEDDKAIKISVVGRPNAGKSTLINNLLGKERLVTSNIAGTTRDAITIDWQYKKHKIKIIDTAGLKKRNQILDDLDKLTAEESKSIIDMSHVVVVVIDASIPLEKQDLSIANMVIKEGRCLVLAINKFDLIESKQKFMHEINSHCKSLVSAIKSVPIVFFSALYNQNINKIIDTCLEVYEKWNKRIKTSVLNEWLKYVQENQPLPIQSDGRRPRIKYVTQVSIRPPAFCVFSTKTEVISDAYVRYLTNSLHENFDFSGCPVRIFLRQLENPYKKD